MLASGAAAALAAPGSPPPGSFEGRPGPRSTEPRRVVVAMPRPQVGRADLDAIAASLADSLRRSLDLHPRYDVVPADSVAAALRESRTVNGVQERLRSDLILSISLIPAKDSVVRMVTLRDLAGPRGFNTRTVVSKVGAQAPTEGIAEMVPRVLRSLQEMERDARMQFIRQGPSSRTNPTSSAPPAAPKPPEMQRPELERP